jgi:hypothetical protein
MKKSPLFTVFILLFAITPVIPTVSSESPYSTQLEDVNVLALVGGGVGENFFDVKTTLESWNCTVDVVSQFSSVYSCSNRGTPTQITADVLISAFTSNESMFSDYDALFVPSGGWWSSASANPTITNFIYTAYENGLKVGSMCVGTGILGAANIVEGKKLCGHSNSQYLITEAGGTMIYLANVIVEENIITGGRGGGISGGGNDVAPFVEFSEIFIKEIFALSFFLNHSIEPVSDNPEYSHYIEVSTQTYPELDTLLSGENRSISRVKVVFYPANSRSTRFSVELDEVAENLFEGYIVVESSGKFILEIEIYTDRDEVEIISGFNSMTINYVIPGFSLQILIISSIGLILFLALLIKNRRI